MSKHLNTIIERLGYSRSANLRLKSNNYKSKEPTAKPLSIQTQKILSILSPFAAFILDNEPFVLFFDETSDITQQNAKHKEVWNAQIPVAIFCSTSSVKIFFGKAINKDTFLLAKADERKASEIDENSPFSFWDITNQDFWERNSSSLKSNKYKGLSTELLNNLKYLTDKLNSVYRIPFATKLVLRLIFIRFLIDRGVDLACEKYPKFSSKDIASKQDALSDLLNNKSDLYIMFDYLKDKFNGNLFETDDEDTSIVTQDALLDIKDFLSAKIRAESKQMALSHLYDFAIIPVELISSIYEILLGKEKNKKNAFYTPKYLVDFILNRTIDKHIEQNETCRILDPSCGSGIFLVDSYRRMIDKKLGGEQFTDNDELLCDTLKENIFGIDIDGKAIDVAIFSLYLAVLDYKEPRTLKEFKLPRLKDRNLIECSFFDDDKLAKMKKKPFDFLVGNPPWTLHKSVISSYINKHREYKQYSQEDDACRYFIIHSKKFCHKNTICCFVLHSRILYLVRPPSKKFRTYLLENTKIHSLFELSAVRHLVFEGAVAPAMALTYSFPNEDMAENRFEHIAMKRNVFFKLFNIIVIEKTDVKFIQQKFLKKNDWAWKTLVYGLPVDLAIILRLKEKEATETLGSLINNKKPETKYGIEVIGGTGIQDSHGKEDAHHLIGQDVLDSKTAIDHFVLHEGRKSKFLKRHKIGRARNRALFKGPYCLFTQGFDISNFRIRAVYSEKDFVYKKAIYGIKGSIEQKKHLLHFVGVVNSSLFAYFNLMLGSYAGIERDIVPSSEVISFPFVLNDYENIAAQVEYIQEVLNPNKEFAPQGYAVAEIENLNLTILRAYGLHEDEFINYALEIQIPQATGKNDEHITKEVKSAELKIYAQYFYDYISRIFKNSGMFVQVNIYPIVAKNYSAVEVVICVDEPINEIVTVDNDEDMLRAMFARFSENKINEQFYYIKDVLFFEENSFYIIKPRYYKNWHPAMARLDLIEANDRILSSVNERGEN